MENKEIKEGANNNDSDSLEDSSINKESDQSDINDKLDDSIEKKNKGVVDQKINIKSNNLTPIKKNEEKPKKELPIEKKPFQEFVNLHLIPTLKEEFNQRGFQIEGINLENTIRPIAGDKCWVIYCEVKDVCNFWLAFENDDISSLKSISLSKPNQKPSIIESFLIDEKRITLKLITSRIFQRLNGQKLIGVN